MRSCVMMRGVAAEGLRAAKREDEEVTAFAEAEGAAIAAVLAEEDAASASLGFIFR